MEDPGCMGFDLIMIVPLLPYHSSFFVFGCQVTIFSGFQHPLVDGCLTASCSFGTLTGGDECMSFYSTILNQTSVLSDFNIGILMLIS